MTVFRCSLFVVALCMLLPGCSDQPELGEVKGTVTLDGKPLTKGGITFEMPDRRPATGTIENGQIVNVTTYEPGDGASVGQHKVAITATEDASSAVTANPGELNPTGNYMTGKSLIPAHYNNPSTSGLTADIKPGENTLEFKLTSEPK